ncbi:MAG: tetratricopeptide repeat protein, partial [Bacteroidota bacterium]
LKQFDKANEYLSQAFSRDSNNSNYYNIKALVLMEQKQYLESVNVFTEGLEKHSEDAFLLNNRGYTYLLMDSVSLASKDINESILMNPSNLWAYRNKGIIAYRNQDFEKAERLFKRALDKRKYVDLVYSYLGLTYLSQGNKQEACRFLKMANEKGETIAETEFLQQCQ